VPLEAGIEWVFARSALPEAVAEADYVVLCINYDTSPYHLIGQAVLAAVKPGAFLISISRGGLIEPDALLEALRHGRLAGAGLDVFWEEPVDPRHTLFRPNEIATPHIAGVTDASFDGTAVVCAENIARYAWGEAPLYASNAPANPGRRQVSSRTTS
jgi:phosphoglycerate dehydrogenase-like enzyme